MAPSDSKTFDVYETLIFKASEEIEKEIQKHKWIESEKAGRDVGYDFARMDWVVRWRSRHLGAKGDD